MWRLIKLLAYLAILTLIALVGYAYIGPIFGVDFAPVMEQQNVPVEIEQG